MKRIFAVCLSALLLLCCACTAENTASPDASNVPSEYKQAIGFNTYDDLFAYFCVNSQTKKSDAGSDDFLSLENTDFSDSIEVYRKFVNKIENDKQIYVPMKNGKPVELRNEEGFSGISVFRQELYGRPWIWYYVPAEQSYIMIRITYMSDEETQYAKKSDGAELLKKISPSAPNIDNYESYNSYKKVYKSQKTLSDRKVSALVSEYNNDQRITIQFAYDDIFVLIMALPEAVSDEWLADLCFATSELAKR